MSVFGWLSRGKGICPQVHAEVRSTASTRAVTNLAAVQPGGKALVRDFTPRLSPERRTQLQAYGVLPGRWVSVSQHSPVTVLQVEHMELALETEISGEIVVEI